MVETGLRERKKQRTRRALVKIALLPGNTPTPDLGPAAPSGVGLYATYEQTQLQVSVGAIDNLFLIGAALGALGALLLRSGSAAPAASAASPPDGGHV